MLINTRCELKAISVCHQHIAVDFDLQFILWIKKKKKNFRYQFTELTPVTNHLVKLQLYIFWLVLTFKLQKKKK